jgi:hypothetical protein
VSAKLPDSDAPEDVMAGGSHRHNAEIRSDTTAMADPTKDKDSQPLDEADLQDEEPGEEFEESTEAGDEDDREFEAAAAASSGRRFGFGRSREAADDGDKQHIGSVRESHERVKIDDRPSAIFALVCAAALIGVLAISWLGTNMPPAAGPTLTPLSVPTAQATASADASASAAASATVAATATPAPSATPTAAPSASPAPSK